MFEFPASGGVIPSSSFRTVKLYEHAVADTKVALAAMTVTALFVVYYTAVELFELHYFGLKYFAVFWNVVDFCIVFVSAVFRVFYCPRFLYAFFRVYQIFARV